jgi:hypothetical protein
MPWLLSWKMRVDLGFLLRPRPMRNSRRRLTATHVYRQILLPNLTRALCLVRRDGETRRRCGRAGGVRARALRWHEAGEEAPVPRIVRPSAAAHALRLRFCPKGYVTIRLTAASELFGSLYRLSRGPVRGLTCDGMHCTGSLWRYSSSARSSTRDASKGLQVETPVKSHSYSVVFGSVFP